MILIGRGLDLRKRKGSVGGEREHEAGSGPRGKRSAGWDREPRTGPEKPVRFVGENRERKEAREADAMVRRKRSSDLCSFEGAEDAKRGAKAKRGSDQATAKPI